VIGNLIDEHGDKIISCHQEAENAIQEVILQVQNLNQIFQSIKPGVLFDIQKYFPHTWSRVNAHKYECVLKGIVKNLERGISEEFYRTDLDIKTIAYIRLQQLNSVLNQQDFPIISFDYRHILVQITELYLYGIASPKGQKLIPQYLNTKN
jgi:hypothetical protein